MNTAPQGADFLKEWNRGDEIGILIDDITKQDRTAFNINEMFTQLQEVVKKYGFDFKMWGLKQSFEQSINKNVSKDKEIMLEVLTKLHAGICIDNGVIRKMPKEMTAGRMQEILLQHNILSENAVSGELTLNNKTV